METLLQNSVVFGDQISSIAKIQEASVVICQRALPASINLEAENLLSDSSFQGIKRTGSFDELSAYLNQELTHLPAILKDITDLLESFFAVIPTENVRLSFVTVRNGMCKKFHTDVTDYRLLCTYKGAGTEFVNPEHVSAHTNDFKPTDVEVLKAGEVILFRGSMSATATCPPLLHRSPKVDHPNEHRVLLRLDTNMTVWE